MLDGGELRLQLPVARGDYEAFVVERADDDEWQTLIDAGLRQTYVNGVAEFALGRPWVAKTSMSVNLENGPYQPNLVEFVEAQGRLKAQPDFDAIVRHFIDRG